MKTVDLEYGDRLLAVQLPDDAAVFVPGQTVPDPPCADDPVAATRESIRNPLGMPIIRELVGPGSKVTISFPDKVKGGAHDTSHRKTCIPILVEECLRAGVDEEDIRLICAIGLHRKNTDDEIRALLGHEIYNRFAPDGRIVNHDAEDEKRMVDLDRDEMGNAVLMNRDIFESDLAILIGHVLGNPYGGYSGGYKMAATGITHWRSIACHHVPEVMHRADFTPVSDRSEMRERFDAIGRHMERKMEGKFFMCDAVLDSRMRQIAAFSGCGEQVQPASWEVADRRTCVKWADKKFDVMLFGMPQAFHYGNGHGTNPILILQAIAANVVRHRRVLKDGCVVVCASLCNGFFNDVEFPSYRPLYELVQQGGGSWSDCYGHAEDFATRPGFVRKYRSAFGYHPFHTFSMVACGEIAHQHCSAIYIVGAQAPKYAHGMGMKTCETFNEALEQASQHVGGNPRILALPRTFKTPAVHLALR